MNRYTRNPLNRSTASGKSLVLLLLLIFAGYGAYSHFTAKPAASSPQPAPWKLKSVVLYSGPSCEPCDRARTFLKQRNVRFQERDVERSPTAQRELEKLGSRIVPVILINDEAFYGFRWAQIDAALRGEKTQSQ